VGFSHHAGDQIDIDLRKAYGTGELIGSVDFLATMGPAIAAEDLFVKILDAETQAGYAHGAENFQFAFGDGARLTLEGDLLGLVPVHYALHGVDYLAELPGGEKGRRAAAEINERGRPAANERLAGVKGQFVDQRFEVLVDLR
jgi:hypothetical protein